MSNEYYNPSGSPSSGSDLTSNPIRSEFVAMQGGFDKMPVMAGHTNHLVYVQSATQLAAASVDALGLATQVELDAETNARIAVDATLVTLASVQTITGKKLFAPIGTAQPGNVEIDVQSNQTGLYVDMGGLVSNGILIDTDAATNNALIKFRYTNNGETTVGSITTNSASTLYNTTSDYRLKASVAPLACPWGVIGALNPVSFVWKNTGQIDTGFIAHEVQSVIPNAVTGEKDGVDYQAMDAKFIIPFLVKAVQDLRQRVLELEGAV